MKRRSLTATLTPEQIDDVKRAFVRLRRSSSEADRLLSVIPGLLRDAIDMQRDLEGLHGAATVRGRTAMARDLRALQQSVTRLTHVLRRRRPEVWSAFGRIKRSDIEASHEVLNRLRVPVSEAESHFKAYRWPKVPRGEHRRYDEQWLLETLAETFIDHGLPLTTTHSGLFSTIALVLHPAEPKPIAIRHDLLATAIRRARESYRPKIKRGAFSF